MNATIRMSQLVLRSVLGLALLMALFAPFATPSRAAPADAAFTVNSTGDIDDPTPDGTCDGGVGDLCTLREAIQESSAASGVKTISFDTALANQTISLSLGSLIVSGDNITIDGTTSGGDVIVDAGGQPANSNVFDVQGNNNTIRGLMLQGWPDTRYPDADYGHGVRIYDPTGSGMASNNTLDALRIYGFEHDGILISGDSGGGGNGNTISNSLIGAPNWASTSCTAGNRWEGIEVRYGPDNTDIDGNWIVCNSNSGIWLDGRGGQLMGTWIQNNKIGTNGTVDMGNGVEGITDEQAIGTMFLNNVISGNDYDGIWLKGSTGDTLHTNLIGTDETGTVALPNSLNGIIISDGANSNAIGNPTAVAGRNIISGNLLCGVEFTSGATNNLLDGNYIGLGSSGTVAIPNQLAGVCVYATGNALSTSTATVNQFISGNSREGVYVMNANVYINSATLIGLAGNGSGALGNGLSGILLDNGAAGSIIYPGQVRYNGGAGIAVVGDSSTGNDIGPGVVGNNAGLGIDLGNDGHTPNDVGDGDSGPNNLLNFPEVNMVVPGSFTGMACPGCMVKFFSVIGDPTANGGGGTYLEYVTADMVTGDFSYTFPPGVTAVTMQACEPTYNCSEFSPSVVNTSAPAIRIYLPMIAR